MLKCYLELSALTALTRLTISGAAAPQSLQSAAAAAAMAVAAAVAAIGAGPGPGMAGQPGPQPPEGADWAAFGLPDVPTSSIIREPHMHFVGTLHNLQVR